VFQWPDVTDMIRPRAWPNPFTKDISLAFSMGAPARVRLEVFDVRGRLVWESPAEILDRGRQSPEWDGRTQTGAAAPSGTYFPRVEGPGVDVSQRVVHMR